LFILRIFKDFEFRVAYYLADYVFVNTFLDITYTNRHLTLFNLYYACKLKLQVSPFTNDILTNY